MKKRDSVYYLVFFSGLMYSEIRGILALKMHNGAKRCVLTRFRPNTVKTLSLYQGIFLSSVCSEKAIVVFQLLV